MIRLVKHIVLSWSALIVASWVMSFFQIFQWWNFRWIVGVLLLANIFFLFKHRKKLNFKLPTDKLTRIIIISVALVWAGFMLYGFAKVTIMPPNNWDSMTYHLTNIARTSETGSIWYDPNINVTRVNYSPAGSAPLMMAAFSMVGADRWVELPQLLAAGLIPLLLVYISRRWFGFSGKWAALSTLFLISIALYWTNSVTTQNDILLVLAFLLAGILSAHSISTGRRRDLIIALMATSIVFGVKYHGMILAVPMAITTLIAFYLKYRQLNKIASSVAISLIPAVVLALPNFIIAQIFYGSFLHQPANTARLFRAGFGTLETNIAHFGGIFYNFPKLDAEYFSHDYGHLGIWFMLCSLFIPAALIYFWRKRDSAKAVFLIPLITFISLFLFIHYPDPFDLRLFMVAPLILGFLSTVFLISKTTGLIKATLILLLIIFSGYTVYHQLRWDFNGFVRTAAKETLRTSDGYTNGEYYYFHRTALREFELSNVELGRGADIIFFGNEDSWVYPYFGNRWQNKIEYADNYADAIRKFADGNYNYMVLEAASSQQDKILKSVPVDIKLLTRDDYSLIYSK
jgi:hypothetical protein